MKHMEYHSIWDEREEEKKKRDRAIEKAKFISKYIVSQIRSCIHRKVAENAEKRFSIWRGDTAK